MSAPNRRTRVLAQGVIRRLRPDPNDDSGFAMIVVIGIGFVLTSILMGASVYAVNTNKSSGRSENYVSALGAAEAGVEDYIAHLNAKSYYWQTNPDTTNPAMVGWTRVPGPTSINSYFRYTANTSTTRNDGVIVVTSTGKVGAETRTISASVRQKSFLDYAYFSDKEMGDPAIAAYNTPLSCGDTYNWTNGYNTRTSPCANINWITADTITGDMHTNDGLQVQGHPTFTGYVTSGCPSSICTSKVWIPNGSGSSPTLTNGSTPTGDELLAMPSTNASMKADATADGCLYTGPTRIVLLGDGTMFVHSPSTPYTAACGGGSPGQVVNQPVGGDEGAVIYVQSIPSGTSAYTSAPCTRPWLKTAASVALDSTSGGANYPLANDKTPYDCHLGDLFLEGTLKGQLSVATDDDVILTGNLKYAGGTSGTDLMGVVAQNQIDIYHPVTSSGSEILGSSQMRNPYFYGALMSVAHSFNRQNYGDNGAFGTLHIKGSLIQKFRGPVGTSSNGNVASGYGKDYQYDTRLYTAAPPDFLESPNAPWHEIQYKEVKPAY